MALKVLSTKLRHAEGRARFQREALLLADLHYPSLAEVYGFGEEHREPFLAMRLVDGVNLRVLQREWKAAQVDPAHKLERVVRWGTQIAEALALVCRAAAPMRETLLTLWWSHELAGDDRLFALFALSGCGAEEDLLPMVESMIELADDLELARITCAAVGRIPLRLTVSGELRGTDFSDVWTVLGRKLTPLLDEGLEGLQKPNWRYEASR